MNICTTTDPVSFNDVSDPEGHPCLYEGDGVNALKIVFENEENKNIYMGLKSDDKKVLMAIVPAIILSKARG